MSTHDDLARRLALAKTRALFSPPPRAPMSTEDLLDFLLAPASCPPARRMALAKMRALSSSAAPAPSGTEDLAQILARMELDSRRPLAPQLPALNIARPPRLTSPMANLFRSAKIRTQVSMRRRFEIIKGRLVPRADALRFDNSGKSIESAVLFVDMRGSTDLHLNFPQETVARMLKCFLGEMARVARHFDADIRGFAGDRIMVIPERGSASATTAVEIAVAMRDIVRHVLNPEFEARQGPAITVGIGIDHGRMLATKVGMQRTPELNDVVWVGAPANMASKITDRAGHNEILLSRPARLLVDGAKFQAEWFTRREEEIARRMCEVWALSDRTTFEAALAEANR